MSRPEIERIQAGLQSLLGDTYTELTYVDAGGMGVVFRAKHASLSELHAIKVLKRGGDDTQSLLARFEREAKLLHQEVHPHVPRVHDLVPVSEETSAISAYMVMTYIDGVPLLRWLEIERSFTEKLEVALQISDALTAVHTLGLIHRDVKDSNVLVDGDGKAWLCDFGVAFSMQEFSRITRVGGYVGTQHFAAPELLQGASSGNVRTDIFAFGVLLWELFHESRFERALAQRTDLVLSEGLLIPPALDSLLRSMVSPEQEERPKSVDEVRRILAAARPEGSGQRIEEASPKPAGYRGESPGLSVRSGEDPLHQDGAATQSEPGRAVSVPRKHRASLRFLSVVGVAVFVIFGISWQLDRANSRSESADRDPNDPTVEQTIRSKPAKEGADVTSTPVGTTTDAGAGNDSGTSSGIHAGAGPGAGTGTDAHSNTAQRPDRPAETTVYSFTMRFEDPSDPASSPEPRIRVLLSGTEAWEGPWQPRVELSSTPGVSFRVVPESPFWKFDPGIFSGTLTDSTPDISCTFQATRSLGRGKSP